MSEQEYSDEFKEHARQVAQGIPPAQTKPIDPLAASRALLARMSNLNAEVAHHAWPALTVETVEDDDEKVVVLKCPWCESLLYPGGGLRAVERSERWSYVRGASNFDAEEISLSNDDRGDFDTEHYAHDMCDKPVTLPEGWTENWS